MIYYERVHVICPASRQHTVEDGISPGFIQENLQGYHTTLLYREMSSGG